MRHLDSMCEQLFGGIANLRRHQSSVLLGINRIPVRANLNRIRTRLTQGDSPIMQILAERTFLYDPLERGGADFWSRDRFLTEIEQMPAIPQELANNLFQTVLKSDDKVMLQRIVENQVGAMRCALVQCDYSAAGCCWRLLNRLRIIEHEEIERRINRQARPHLHAHATERMDVFREHVVQRDFTEAARLQASLCSLQTHFPDENLVVLESLEATLQTAQEQYNAQQEAEKQVEEERKNAEEAQQRVEQERKNAEEARKNAEEAQKSAEQERKNAEEARKNEEEAQKSAEQERKNAEEARENAAEHQQRAEESEKARRILEAERNSDRRTREEMTQRMSNLERALEEEKKRANNELLGVAIMGCVHLAGKAIERK
jgi:chromosome segregation ATPase